MTDDSKLTVSRRSVLRNGATVTGVIAVGGAASGTVGGQPGGMGGNAFLTETTFTFVRDWRAFVFEDDGDGRPVVGRWVLRQHPGCTNGQPEEYQSYWVRNAADVNKRERRARRRVLFLDPNRNVNVGVPVSIRTRSNGCEGDVVDTRADRTNDATTYRISFGPA